MLKDRTKQLNAGSGCFPRQYSCHMLHFFGNNLMIIFYKIKYSIGKLSVQFGE